MARFFTARAARIRNSATSRCWRGGPECYCGTRGCYEIIAAGPAIADAGAAIDLDGSEAVFAAAAGGEPKAGAIIDGVVAATEVAVWSLLHTYLPEAILFGGGIVDGHWPLFEAAAQKSLAAAVLERDEGVTIARASLGNDAGMVGAASWFYNKAANFPLAHKRLSLSCE